MACGCADTCNCYLLDSETTSVSGTGTAGDPYIATVIPDPEGGLEATADGVAVKLDPASTAPVSVGPDGLKVDCCGDETGILDTESVNLSIALGIITADVIVDPEGGLEVGADGVAIELDPDSTADVSLSATGLRVDLPAADVIAAAVPTGVVWEYDSPGPAPAGWLMLDNSEGAGGFVPQASYPDLFAAVGHRHNGGVDPGDGTFKLADRRGRHAVGLGTHADVNALGDSDALGVASRTPQHVHADGTLAATAVGTGVSVTSGAAGVTVSQTTPATGSSRTNDVTDQITGADNTAIEESAGLIGTGVNLAKALHDHHVNVLDPGHIHGVTDPGHGHDVAGSTAAAGAGWITVNYIIKT